MFPDSLFLTICSLQKYGIFNFLDPFPAYNLGTPYSSKLQSGQKSNPCVTPIPYVFSCSLTNTVPGFSSYPRGAQLRQYDVFVPKPSYKSPVKPGNLQWIGGNASVDTSNMFLILVVCRSKVDEHSQTNSRCFQQPAATLSTCLVQPQISHLVPLLRFFFHEFVQPTNP